LQKLRSGKKYSLVLGL